MEHGGLVPRFVCDASLPLFQHQNLAPMPCIIGVKAPLNGMEKSWILGLELLVLNEVEHGTPDPKRYCRSWLFQHYLIHDSFDRQVCKFYRGQVLDLPSNIPEVATSSLGDEKLLNSLGHRLESNVEKPETGGHIRQGSFLLCFCQSALVLGDTHLYGLLLKF